MISDLRIALLTNLKDSSRITLGEVLYIAKKFGISDKQAFICIESLNLHRFYVDRSGNKACIMNSSDVCNIVIEPELRKTLALSIEVVWAANETAAILER
jgi:hypothetical protein